jgi:hypothetical protein
MPTVDLTMHSLDKIYYKNILNAEYADKLFSIVRDCIIELTDIEDVDIIDFTYDNGVYRVSPFNGGYSVEALRILKNREI